MIQAGRVKLHKFHIGNFTTRAPGHGYAVAGTYIRVTCIQVNLAGPTGSQHRVPGPKDLHPAFFLVINIGADAVTVLDDEIKTGMKFKQFDIAVGAGTILKGAFNCLAGGIRGVQDPPVTVAAFLVKVKLPALGFRQAGKIDAEIH